MKTKVFIILIAFHITVAQLSFGALDRGYLCPEHEPYIAYQFDSASETCLAFKYLGCGGNYNRFSSERDCYEKTITRAMHGDYASCPLHSTIQPVEADKTEVCGYSWFTPLKCPPKCPENSYQLHLMFSFSVVCCNKEAANLLNKNKNPTCPHGSFKRIGKSCSDDFCDDGYDCVQNELFATCCPKLLKKENGTESNYLS